MSNFMFITLKSMTLLFHFVLPLTAVYVTFDVILTMADQYQVRKVQYFGQ